MPFGEEAIFYEENYKNIKKTEIELITQVYSTVQAANEQSESKLIEHIVSRIKTPESAMKKLELAGYEQTAENAIAVLSDIIGIRLIVHFVSDIYTIRNLLVNSGKFVILKEKDYIKSPKPTGYRGYHIILWTNFNDFSIKAEIQIRTIAMDCWASLEHQIRYKKGIKNNDLIDFELKRCSENLMATDIAMERVWTMVKESTEDLENDENFFTDAMMCTMAQK